MNLMASVTNEQRYDEFLAEVEVTSDTAEQWGPDYFRRKVVGQVRKYGPIWNAFIGAWVNDFFRPEKQPNTNATS